MSNQQPGLFDDPDDIARNPVKPYAGEHGHSGTDTSRERAQRQLGNVQALVLNQVTMRGANGATVHELRSGAHHHGTVSGALSELHKAGILCRLLSRRQGCRVYVAPQFVHDRETDEQRSNVGDSEVITMLRDLQSLLNRSEMGKARRKVNEELLRRGEQP